MKLDWEEHTTPSGYAYARATGIPYLHACVEEYESGGHQYTVRKADDPPTE